jgi:hypothetical protein
MEEDKGLDKILFDGHHMCKYYQRARELIPKLRDEKDKAAVQDMVTDFRAYLRRLGAIHEKYRGAKAPGEILYNLRKSVVLNLGPDVVNSIYYA